MIVQAGDDEVTGDVKVPDELAEILNAFRGSQDAQAGDVVGAAADQELDSAALGNRR